MGYSIIVPAYNEEGGIGKVLEDMLALKLENVEIVVVNDHSHDETGAITRKYPVTVLDNIQNSGYGYSLKKGIKAAKYENIIITDADGSYPINSIPTLIKEYEKGFDMVVGARKGQHYSGSLFKRIGRFFFRFLSEFTTGRRIPDINSGFRVFKKDVAMRFFKTLSNGFSFTTTITLAYMLNSYIVHYMPIEYHKRAGTSKVKYVRDTLRAAQIIIEAIIFYNPIKIYILCAAAIFISGLLATIIAIWCPTIAAFLFATVVGTMLALCIGFIGVFLKFMHEE